MSLTNFIFLILFVNLQLILAFKTNKVFRNDQTYHDDVTTLSKDEPSTSTNNIVRPPPPPSTPKKELPAPRAVGRTWGIAFAALLLTVGGIYGLCYLLNQWHSKHEIDKTRQEVRSALLDANITPSFDDAEQ